MRLATTQKAYEKHLTPLFDTLDFYLEQQPVEQHVFYLGRRANRKADWAPFYYSNFAFDAVYFGHF